MLFNSPFFLFIFLPLVLLFYLVSPKKLKNLVLLLSSLFFYSWGEKELVLLILLSTLVDYCCGLIIYSGKRKLGLLISIVFNLSILIYFKYASFLFTNLSNLLVELNISEINANSFSSIILPLGISFYTFQTMSYSIDVYRGHIKANKNFIEFATYVALFPQLIAGPIIKYRDVEKELKNRTVTISLFAQGVERFIIGLAKKMIIANNCAFLVDGIFNMPVNEMSATLAWIGIIAYSFQIYFDFSGYSDMAIGLGKMFGFNFIENFNYPYISKSIQEFWRRWHISLSSWFKEYLYFSLGGNRKGTTRTYINLFIVFLVTGLWHGANWTFVVWGILHGVFMIIERIGFIKTLNKIGGLFSTIYTLFVVNIAWVFFRSETLFDALQYIKAMFNFNTKTNIDFLNFYLNKEIIFVLIIACILSTPIYRNFNNYILQLNTDSYKSKVLLSLKVVGLISIFIISYIYIATDSYNPFIYYRF